MIDFADQTILVTGGTGSLGQTLVRFLLAKTKAKKIIVFSRDELKQSEMQKALPDNRLRFFIGDIRDKERLERALHGVDVVVHTAALKQIPALEYNPFEAVKTNIIGTQNVIDSAIDQGVKKVLLVSTDKASQPINLYGATKLTVEKLGIAGNSYGSGKTIFSVVRYGNVFGSRGSIIDVLLKDPSRSTVHVTHPEMTRFWITLDQAIDLVMFALDNMEGGEIFIPKLPSMKLLDVFAVLAPKAKQEIIGIRPGEKLHESLLTEDEARHSLELQKHYVILPEFNFFAKNLYQKYQTTGKVLPAGFRYSSNTNAEWLDPAALETMLKNIIIK